MAARVEFVAFTVVPLFAMGGTVIYIAVKLYKLDVKGPVLLIALLALMILHQLTEIAQFAAGTYYRTTSPPAETFESVANLLASIASYFVVQQIAELRATRNELEASNAALTERSSMVSVLNRILRHNVRNDVNVIAGNAERLRKRCTTDQSRRDLQTIADTAWRLATISDRTQRIRRLLAEDATSTTTFGLRNRLESSIERVRADAPDATITIDGVHDTDAVIDGPTTFPVAVTDVVEQIVASNDGSADVEITITRDHTDEGSDTVRIVIDDDGDGLPELDVQALENERETPLEHAEGLSLWCLEWTVKRAGGDLDIQPDDATVEIRLPQAE